jgi:dihydroflavonol-4-reductase
MKPTILITGANGYTGHFFTHYLGRKGLAVRAMYYPPDGKPDHAYPNVELVPGDLRNRDEVAASLQGIDTVYHIAALYRPTNVPESVYEAVNVGGTRNMVELSVAAGVRRFINTSTIGVHGTVGRAPVDEDGPIAPDDYYQNSKWRGEQLAHELASQLGLSLTTIRPAGIYGPREHRFLKITQLIQKRRFVMFGSGETYYHFVHVKDLSDAYLAAAERPTTAGRSYIIADDHAITIQQFVNSIADALGSKRPGIRLPYGLLKVAALACEVICKPLRISPPIHRRRAAWFVSNRTFDISRARTELEYEPKVRIEDGIAEMVESYRDAGWV